MKKELTDYLTKLENDIAAIDESDVFTSIKKILRDDEEKITEADELAEYTAFAFHPSSEDNESGWGTHYGPLFQMKGEDGSWREFPSQAQVTEPVINIWESRAKVTAHPILRFRYADLAFDFTKKNTGKPNVEMARIVIDSAIEIFERDLCKHPVEYRDKIERALELAVYFKDEERQKKLSAAFTQTEAKHAEDEKAGLWGNAFELLVSKYQGKLVLGDGVVEQLTKDIEERVDRLMSQDDTDPWLILRAVDLLAPHYRRLDDKEKLEQLLGKLSEAFRNSNHQNSSGLLISNYLQRLRQIYLQYVQYDFAGREAKKILNEISTLGDSATDDMKKISAEVQVSEEDVNKLLGQLFAPDIETVIPRIVHEFVPNREAAEKQLKDFASSYPMQYMFNTDIIAEGGYVSAVIRNIQEDYDLHLIRHVTQMLQIHDFFLAKVVDKFRKTFSQEDFKSWLLQSAVIKEEDAPFLDKLLTAFYNDEYLFFSSASIPIIEDAVRHLFTINNLSYLKPTEDGSAYQAKSLNVLLAHDLVQQTFGGLAENMILYLRIVLTEEVGLNLRNTYAHGINKLFFLTPQVANRLFHILLCLSLIRFKEKD